MKRNLKEKLYSTIRNEVCFFSFLEGFLVMSIELLGAKMIFPHYGASLYIWTAVLGTTMFALATGYFTGAALSKSKYKNKLFDLILFGTSFSILIFSLNSSFWLKLFSGIPLLTAAILTSLSVLFIPLFIVALINPILIHISTSDAGSAGKTSGKVFFVSTLAGIAAAFLWGFWLIPVAGVETPFFILAVIIQCIALIRMIVGNRWMSGISSTAIIILVVAFHMRGHQKNYRSILYESNGLLGKLTVLETPSDQREKKVRRLLINGIPQTYVLSDENLYSYWEYVHIIGTISSLKSGKKAALFGLGGGSVAKELLKQQIKLDVVELDPRIPQVASDYFYLPLQEINLHIDDARHFVKSSTEKYDLMVFDLLSAEVQPSHVFTIEALAEVKKRLNHDGIVIINFQGFESGEEGIGPRSVFNTLLKAGFYTYVWIEQGSGIKDIIFYASTKPVDLSKLDFSKLNECCRSHKAIPEFFHMPHVKIPPGDYIILTDNHQRLELLNQKTILEWRRNMIVQLRLIQKFMN